jgi:hypothetical protein
MRQFLRLIPMAGLLAVASCDGYRDPIGMDELAPVGGPGFAVEVSTVGPFRHLALENQRINVTAPAAAAGDLLVAQIAVVNPGSTTVICSPDGWESAASQENGNGAIGQAIFYRKVTSAESATVHDFTFKILSCGVGGSQEKRASGVITKFSDVDVSGDPIFGSAAAAGNSSTATAPAVADAPAGSYVLRFITSWLSATVITPTTDRLYEDGVGAPAARRIAAFGKEQAVSGSTGTFVATVGSVDRRHIAHTVVLKAAPTGSKTATAISDVSGSGVYGGSAALTATLKAGTVGVEGKQVLFKLGDIDVCGSSPLPACPTTNASGVAMLDVILPTTYTVPGSPHAGEVEAIFAEDDDYLGSNATGDLTVDKASQTLTWLTEPPASFRFGGTFQAQAQGGGSTEPIVYSLSGDCSFTGTGPITVTADSYTGDCTVKANRAGDDNHDAADELSEDVTMLPALTTVELTVTSSPVQYSDLIDLSATVAPCTLSGEDVTGSVTFYVDGVQVGSAQTLEGDGDDCTVGITGHQVLLEPSATDYEVEAVFSSTNAHFEGDTDTEDLTVEREDAKATYTGLLYVSTASTTSGSFSTQLTATIQDITAAALDDPKYDPSAGDIRNARVTFRVNGTAVCSNLVPQLVSAGDTKTGTVICPWSGTINNDATTYDMAVEVNGYYQGVDQVSVTVARGSQNSITGGGFFFNTSSAGTYAATTGLRTNFGFNVKFNSAGRQLQGQVNLIFHIDDVSGERTYQVKSNAIDNLTADVPGGTAVFQSKGNLLDVTNPDAPVSVAGNLLIQMHVLDGDPNRIAFTLRNSAGQLIYASAWDGVTAPFMNLLGGNIAVR